MGGMWRVGELDQCGQFTGNDIATIYPDLKTALVGEYYQVNDFTPLSILKNRQIAIYFPGQLEYWHLVSSQKCDIPKWFVGPNLGKNVIRAVQVSF